MLDLYDAVGHGMWAYSNAAFRVDVLDRERFEPARRKTGRLHFAARDDMFLPGFFAGFPPELPLRARRVLYKVGVARWLPAVNVFPIRSATVARVGEVLAARRGEALDDLLAEGRVSDLRERAARCGLPRPARAEDVLRGEYADLLWQPISPGDGGGLEDFWAGRAAQAAGDFRTLVQIARDGNVLVVFPEGRPSPDGEIGPIRPGIGALVRRGRPTAIRPLAIAYDPLVRGRPRVHLALGDPVEPPKDDVEGALLALLRLTMPLTCGQFVSTKLEGDLADAVALAREEGRPVEPDVRTSAGRRRRLAEALAIAPRKAAELPVLAREYVSARS